VEKATLRWADWFANHRLLGPIGYVAPAQAETNYYAAIDNRDMAAGLKRNCSGKAGTLHVERA
jgi:putative transposase